MDIKELRENRAAIGSRIDETTRTLHAMLDNPASADATGAACFNEEQEAQYQKLEASLKADQQALAVVDRDIERWETIQEAENQVKAVRIGKAESFDETRVIYAEPKARTPKLFANFGEQLKAIRDISLGYNNPTGIEKLHKINAAAIGAGESIGADGGFLVQQDFSNDIFTKMHDMGQVLSRVRRVPVSGNGLKMPAVQETSRATGSRWGGVQGYWVGEGVAPTATQPQFSQIELTLKRVAALGYATEELLEDAGAMSTIFVDAFAEELRWIVENSFINGSGAGEPTGILQGASLISAAAETGQAATTIVFENIVNMYARLHAGSRANAVWFINQDIEPQLFTMSLAVGTGGVPVYLPAGGASGSPFGTLMGRAVIPTEYNATLGTVGDIILADMSQYMSIDKGGVQNDTSIHVRFTTNEQAFRATYRVDGRPLWNSALTPANGSNTQSPFVALATRS